MRAWRTFTGPIRWRCDTCAASSTEVLPTYPLRLCGTASAALSQSHPAFRLCLALPFSPPILLPSHPPPLLSPHPFHHHRSRPPSLKTATSLLLARRPSLASFSTLILRTASQADPSPNAGSPGTPDGANLISGRLSSSNSIFAAADSAARPLFCSPPLLWALPVPALVHQTTRQIPVAL